MRFLLLLALLLSSSSAQVGEKRTLFVMGGRSDYNPEIYSAFIEAAGGVGVARVGIVSAASSTPVQSGHAYEEVWDNVGAAETYWIPVYEQNKEAAFDPEVIENTLRMTGIYFSGGDQTRIINSLFIHDDDGVRLDTPLMTAIRSLYESAEAVVGGDSAGGTALTGSVMPVAGESYNALLNGAHPEETGDDLDLVYDPEGGMGFLPGFVLDTHFTQRGREGRLIRLLTDTSSSGLGSERGMGVDEDSAVMITSDIANGGSPVGDVLGTYGVYFADVSRANVDTAGGFWSVDTVYAHYLGSGDSVDLSTWTDVTYADFKTNMAGDELYVEAPESAAIFAGDYTGQPGEYEYIATQLIDSKVDSTFGDTLELAPRFRVYLTKGQYTEGYGGYPEGPFGNEQDFVISYQDMLVDIEVT